MNKSLLGTTLVLVFSLVAYAVYVYALLTQNNAWTVVSALLYFFPVYTEFLEEFPNIRVDKKWQLMGMIACVVSATLCLVSMFIFLSLVSDGSSTVHIVFKIVLAILPVTCIPIKTIPFIQALYQWYNRNTDSPETE